MCRKLIRLASFVLVLSAAGNASAELVAHWRFDEGSGNTAFDSTAGGNDGTLAGDPQWVAGKIGGALDFDGNGDYVDCGNSAVFNITDELTVAAWVNLRSVPGDWRAIIAKGDDAWRLATWGAAQTMNFAWTGSARGYQNVGSTTALAFGEWYHVCGVYSTADGGRIYINGIEEALTPDTLGVTTGSYPVYIGDNSQNTGRFWDGLIDDVRVYNHALSETEIEFVMQGEGYPYALGPVPADGALYPDTWVSLGWKAGDFAVSHNVYMGESFDDVNEGAGDTFLANVPENYVSDPYLIVGFIGFPFPDGLVPGTTYYWRIDEINDLDPNSPWKGDVWSFSIPPKKAYDPVPGDGVRFVDTDLTLTWTPGFGASLHTVYFGDDFDTVNNAAGGTALPFTTYTPGALELDKTYYWRVDETDDVLATHRGDVWSFKTLPDIPIVDPNLMGWWKLDEGSGATALDWSGHGHHGTLIDGPQWAPGYDGYALEFDGFNDTVNIPYVTDPTVYTICAWVRPAVAGAANIIVRTSGSGPMTHWSHQLRINSAGVFEHYVWDGTARTVIGTTTVRADTWYHVVGIATDNGQVQLYVNGWAEGASDTVGAMWAEGDRFVVGSSSGGGMGQFNGLIDDVRVYDKALTQEEVKQTMRGDPLLAWDPSPTNGSTPNVDEAVPLSWSPGDKASQHDVYFGLDRDALDNADASDTTGIYRDRQGGTSYTPPEGVEWGTGPYYWRIDEYNTDATLSKGRVWNFTVADFIGIDDMEQYDVDNAIWANWHDGLGYVDDQGVTHPGNGTGSEVGDSNSPSYTEETIVRGGRQSMPYWYNNSGSTGKFNYSEAKLTLTDTRNWTEENVKALSLWFYGDPANAAEQMYLAVANNTGAPAVVQYPGDAGDLKKATWQEWNIDLREFTGISLTDVNSIAIGFGNRNTPQIGGSGKMYFDDIRLYRARCVSSLLKPDADLSGNCVVDLADIEMMGADWLATDSSIAATAPSSPPIGWWKFDNNTNDSAGNNPGAANGFPSYTAGMDGQAISLDGVDDYVSIGGVGISGAAPRTIAGWVKANALVSSLPNWINIFGFTGPSGGDGHFDLEIGEAQGRRGYVVHVYGWERVIMDVDLDWHHLAASYDGTTLRWYGDGEIVDADSSRNLNTPDNVHAGKREDNDNYFPGSVDDARIYNYVLSDAEIAGLVDDTPGDGQLYIPVPSVANIYDDEPEGSRSVDFKDFAILADSWLEELLWPQP